MFPNGLAINCTPLLLLLSEIRGYYPMQEGSERESFATRRKKKKKKRINDVVEGVEDLY